MVGFISNIAPLLNYLRGRSPGPPFPPDSRQAGDTAFPTPSQLPQLGADGSPAKNRSPFWQLWATLRQRLRRHGALRQWLSSILQ